MKFTVHTKTNLADYLKNDFAVTRLHEDFVWLHDDIRGDKTFQKIYYFNFLVPYIWVAYVSLDKDLFFYVIILSLFWHFELI